MDDERALISITIYHKDGTATQRAWLCVPLDAETVANAFNFPPSFTLMMSPRDLQAAASAAISIPVIYNN